VFKFKKFFLILIIFLVGSSLIEAKIWFRLEGGDSGSYLRDVPDNFYSFPVYRKIYPCRLNFGFDIIIIEKGNWSLEAEANKQTFANRFNQNSHEVACCDPLYQEYSFEGSLNYKINSSYKIFAGLKLQQLHSTTASEQISDWHKAFLGIQVKKLFSDVKLESKVFLSYYYQTSRLIHWEKECLVQGKAFFPLNNQRQFLLSVLLNRTSRKEEKFFHNNFFEIRNKVGLIFNKKIGGFFIGLTNKFINLGPATPSPYLITGVELTFFIWKY